MSDLKKITFTTDTLPLTDTSIDILSFDIGSINMAVAKLRYDIETKRLCILNAMLLNIFNPFQTLNENDKDFDTETEFPVDAYYADQPSVHEIQQANEEFSKKQFTSRKRARVTAKTDLVLPFVTDTHPNNTGKRRRKTLDQSQIPKGLAKNWALIGAQLSFALEGHKFMSCLDDIDFILLEQQDRTNPQTRALCMSIITYYETKRQTLPQNRRQRRGASENSLWGLAPFIKICSAVNKLGAEITTSMQTDWIFEETTRTHKLTTVQIRALLKKYFIPPASNVADSSNYSKRKISSKDEITKFFCCAVINRARSLSLTLTNTLPEKCDEKIIEQLANVPVNDYAHWIVNQLGAKNNVTDALLQAFSWIQQCKFS